MIEEFFTQNIFPRRNERIPLFALGIIDGFFITVCEGIYARRSQAILGGGGRQIVEKRNCNAQVQLRRQATDATKQISNKQRRSCDLTLSDRLLVRKESGQPRRVGRQGWPNHNDIAE
jgi:hypothetical protein